MTAKGRAELEIKRAELEDAIRRLELFKAAIVSFERDLDGALNWSADQPVKRGQAQKFDREGRPTKYNRARPKWKARHGYEFACGILEIQARDKCTVAAAVRELKKSDPKKWPEPERALQRRYQEIKDYWGPWCQIEMMLEAEAAALLAKTELLTKG